MGTPVKIFRFTNPSRDMIGIPWDMLGCSSRWSFRGFTASPSWFSEWCPILGGQECDWAKVHFGGRIFWCIRLIILERVLHFAEREFVFQYVPYILIHSKVIPYSKVIWSITIYICNPETIAWNSGDLCGFPWPWSPHGRVLGVSLRFISHTVPLPLPCRTWPGNDCYSLSDIENGPVEIVDLVDLAIDKMVDFSSSLCKRLL